MAFDYDCAPYSDQDWNSKIARVDSDLVRFAKEAVIRGIGFSQRLLKLLAEDLDSFRFRESVVDLVPSL